jgi:DNA-binding MarR family transcriptional regulator
VDLLLLEFVQTLHASLERVQEDARDRSGFSTLTISQLQYIDAIQGLGAPCISEVARRLGVTKPSTTSGINNLVRLGFVTKTPSRDDRRVIQVGLTESARRLVAARAKALRDYGRFIDSALGPREAAQFQRLIAKLVTRFKAGAAK